MHDPRHLEPTLRKVGKLQYKEIRHILKSYSSRFSHLQEDADLKRMGTVQAVELVHWFNEHAFGIPREYLLSNYNPQFYAEAQMPMPDRSEQCLLLTNSNLLFYRGLARINQHMPYHFSMLLRPENYPAQWKHILWQMLDFMEFKETMAPKHYELVGILARTDQDHT